MNSSRINTSGPQCEGPDLDYVRKDNYTKNKKYINMAIGFKPYMIMQIIEKHINRRNFGSSRCYELFGIDVNIEKKINNDIQLKKHILCQKIIQKWYFENKYRPGGIGYKKAEEHFAKMVAKKK